MLPLMNTKHHTNFHTKKQLESLFKAWNVDAAVPRKNQITTIIFPKEHFNVAKITYSEHKATYGERLYKLVMFHKVP